MILTKAKLDEQTELSFSMEVFGTPDKAEDVRFVIEHADYSILIPCKRTDNEVTVVLPKMKGILESGSYDIRMEVIIDGRIFTPLKETIEFESLVEFDVKKQKATSVKEGVRITPKSMSSEDVRAPKPKNMMEDHLRTVMEEGYDVVVVNKEFIIKKGDEYHGIIEESGPKIAKKSLGTLQDLKRELKSVK